MRALLNRTTFLNTYLALPQAPFQLLPQQLPRQSSLFQSPPQSPLPQSSPPESTRTQRSLLHSPQSQHVNHTPPALPPHIWNLLIEEGKYREGAWVGLSKERKPSIQEKDVYNIALMEIFERIAQLTREYYPNIESIPGKWVNTNQTPLQTWSKNGVPDLKPDVIFAHDETSADEVLWSRTFSVLEVVKRHPSEALDAQLKTYVSHIFAEQVDRLFVNAVTLRGCQLQVYRFDHSGVVCMQDKIDIHESPEDFIQVIASFSYLSLADLGWDSTCKVWDSATKSPRPSYELPQNTFRNCGVYDIPWVLEVADENFVVIGAVNAHRSLSIWGRGSFVVHAVTLQDWKSKNAQAKVFILKQCWQRLPGLESNPKTIELRNADGKTPEQSDREGLIQQIGDVDKKPFEETVMERAGWMDRLKKSWMVGSNGKPITIFDTIRKNHATCKPMPESSPLRENKRQSTEIMGTPESSLVTTPGTLETTDEAPADFALVTRTLVRLVFDRPGWPIERFTSKRELLLGVKMIVQELGLLYKKGVIHRDVSPSNLIISDSGGHIIDFDHSEVAFEKDKEVEQPEEQDVFKIAVDMLHTNVAARHYVLALLELWEIDGQPATPTDFHWSTKLEAVYLFRNRKMQDGFFTGTYQYLSHHLAKAPFHHCTHDLDSLFWSVNTLPLKFKGPGGMKRQDIPLTIIDTYYNGGPGEKQHMAEDFATTRTQFDHMTSQYSDYFKDLTHFMEKWYHFNYIACLFRGYEHYQPHDILVQIIDEAINGLGPEAEKGYEDAADKERARRRKQKDDMAEAISKQMTITALLKERVPATEATNPTTTVSAARNPLPIATEPNRPSTPRLVVCIPTVQSPETDRVVKKLRGNLPEA